MKIPRVLLAGLLVALAASQSATAASIMGTLAIATDTTTLTPSSADLSNATSVNWVESNSSAQGTGDLNVIPTLTIFTPSGTLTIANLTQFNYDFKTSTTDYGTFQAGAGSFIVTRTASFLDVYLLGTFTPAGGLPGFSQGAASLRLSFTYANVGGNISVSGSGTLSSPPQTPPGIPEPASLALVGIGLVSVTAFRSLRKRVGK
jgi:hypothetical protein